MYEKMNALENKSENNGMTVLIRNG